MVMHLQSGEYKILTTHFLASVTAYFLPLWRLYTALYFVTWNWFNFMPMIRPQSTCVQTNLVQFSFMIFNSLQSCMFCQCNSPSTGSTELFTSTSWLNASLWHHLRVIALTLLVTWRQSCQFCYWFVYSPMMNTAETGSSVVEWK